MFSHKTGVSRPIYMLGAMAASALRERERVMKLVWRALLAVVAAAIMASAAFAQGIPNPVLTLTGTEHYAANGQNFVRYRFSVFNRDAYPAAMFAAAPDLPPCGSNTNASRSWVDFYDKNGKRLYGFCALGSPADLGRIWFATKEGTIPPSYVYIEITDRQTNTKYKSNLADTVI